MKLVICGYPNIQVTILNEQKCLLSTDQGSSVCYYSSSVSTIDGQDVAIYGNSQKFHCQKAIAGGNLLRHLLGKPQPFHVQAYDAENQVYYRLSESVLDSERWSDIVDVDSRESPPSVLIKGEAYEESGPLLDNTALLGMAIFFIADYDVNPSNILCVRNNIFSRLVKLDMECAFGYTLYHTNSSSLIVKILRNIVKAPYLEDYCESILDELDDAPHACELFFHPTHVKEQMQRLLVLLQNLNSKILENILNDSISDEFSEQKKLILDTLLIRRLVFISALEQFLFPKMLFANILLCASTTDKKTAHLHNRRETINLFEESIEQGVLPTRQNNL